MKRKNKNVMSRTLAAFLTCTMVFSSFSVSLFAEEEGVESAAKSVSNAALSEVDLSGVSSAVSDEASEPVEGGVAHRPQFQ